jgi:pleiotropic regulator 1
VLETENKALNLLRLALNVGLDFRCKATRFYARQSVLDSSSLTMAPDLKVLLQENAKRSRALFAEGVHNVSDTFEESDRLAISYRMRSEYDRVRELPAALAAKVAGAAGPRKKQKTTVETADASDARTTKLIEGVASKNESAASSSTALTLRRGPANDLPPNANGPTAQRNILSSSLVRKQTVMQIKPEWHAPWKLMRVISGHLGWVRSLAVEPENKWFASGAGDRTIKIWDLATGSLRLTLTGHISTVRGLAVSPRHPYLFSCGEDKMVKCWDLETNKVIRHYHGHLSGVYTLSLHPTLDVLVTGGRDGVARVWDMRTRSNIHVLSGHKGTVSDVKCQEADPQVITSSLDSTVRLWDLAAGKTMGVLTHHKKGVRALAIHPKEFTFASGSTGSIKQWKCPEGGFMQNFEGQNSIINTLAVNEDNVLFSGGDNGSMSFWDWKSGHRFQALDTTAQPGSLDAETGLMSSTYDKTGLRLICGEADKTIKIWKQDETATPETHPLEWKPTLGRQKF